MRAAIQNQEGELRRLVQESVRSGLGEVESRLVTLRVDFLLHQAESCLEERLHGNAFIAYIEAAQISRRVEKDYVVGTVLSELEQVIKKMDKVYASDIGKLGEFVAQLDRTDPKVERFRQARTPATERAG